MKKFFAVIMVYVLLLGSLLACQHPQEKKVKEQPVTAISIHLDQDQIHLDKPQAWIYGNNGKIEKKVPLKSGQLKGVDSFLNNQIFKASHKTFQKTPPMGTIVLTDQQTTVSFFPGSFKEKDGKDRILIQVKTKNGKKGYTTTNCNVLTQLKMIILAP